MGTRETCRACFDSRTLWMAVLVPVVLLPLPILNPSEVSRCGYCLLVIAFFWVTEIIPLAVTSLLPIVLFPVFGIMSAKDTCMSYAKDTLMLFMGSLMVAVGVERWNLHKRIALRTLSLVGPQPKWLLFGIMLPCWFLSMWMSNTATAAMMMPIVNAILDQIKLTRHQHGTEETSIAIENRDSAQEKVELEASLKSPALAIEEENRLTVNEKRQTVDKEFICLAKSFSLCVAFAANVGGMATLTGTPPNIIFKGQADLTFSKAGGSEVNFANWLAVGLPISAILFVFVWGWLYIYTVRTKILKCCQKDQNSYFAVRNVIRREASKLGTMTFPEVIVLVNFTILALLWVTRKPGFIPGWGNLLKEGYSGDSVPAILIAIILFILPAKIPSFRRKGGDLPVQGQGYQPILTWKAVNDRMAWGVILLMGGGFALADACQRSGLSKWVSGHLLEMSSLEPWIIAMVLSIIISLATQVTSNAATATLFLPIVGEMATTLGLNPLYFMIPCTLSTSLAFLLPVATPPNAIVFASGYLQVKDMVVVGFGINVFALIVVNCVLNAWAVPFYKLDVMPEFLIINRTLVPNITPRMLLNLTLTP
ncbi:solute carrier family 13 member 2-like [Haliotis rubra]|uniref:solute carrier family 13 member 2-like n=1 Tax=Haliotis rubra TaxID=36100 RepID=UPI001EE62D9F|nr:solute carrier family 13 member 2-like [Haliotis rubra]